MIRKGKIPPIIPDSKPLVISDFRTHFKPPEQTINRFFPKRGLNDELITVKATDLAELVGMAKRLGVPESEILLLPDEHLKQDLGIGKPRWTSKIVPVSKFLVIILAIGIVGAQIVNSVRSYVADKESESAVKHPIQNNEEDLQIKVASAGSMERPGCNQKTQLAYEHAIEDENGKIFSNAVAILRENKCLGPLHLTQVFHLYTWLRDNMEYVDVIEDSAPKKVGVILDAKAGDCKNMAAALVALGASINARMAIILSSCNGEDCFGHSYAALRVYEPTAVEKTDPERLKKAYAQVEMQVNAIVGREYSELKDSINSNGINYLYNNEGMWIVLDPTFEKCGYPGLRDERFKNVTELYVFGDKFANLAIK